MAKILCKSTAYKAVFFITPSESFCVVLFCDGCGHWQHRASGGPRGRGVARSAAQLPFSRAKCPAYLAKRVQRVEQMHGARFFFFLVGCGWHWLTLLAAVPRSAQAVVHTRRLNPSLAALSHEGHRQRDAPRAACWLCPSCATAAIWGGKSRTSCTDCTKRTDCTHNAS